MKKPVYLYLLAVLAFLGILQVRFQGASRPAWAAPTIPSTGQVNVRSYGALGNGTADDRLAVQAALAAVGARPNGGSVYFPPGVYVLSKNNGSSTCVSLLSKVNLVGAGSGPSILKVKDNQPEFTRLLTGNSVSQVSISGLTLDGNEGAGAGGAGNQPGNTLGQNHLVFLNGCTDVVVRDCTMKGCFGDAVYWFNSCIRPSVTGCYMYDIYRTGLHAQYVTDGIFANNHCSLMHDNNWIKAEIDNFGEIVRGLVVSGNTFDGDATSFGVQMSGLFDGIDTDPMSPTFGDYISTTTDNLTVTGNTFSNLLAAVSIGQASNGWNVSGNLIVNCRQGVSNASYNAALGYANNQNIVIANNTMRQMTGTTVDDWGISLSNTTSGMITGNSIANNKVIVNSGGTHAVVPGGLLRGIRLSHCDHVRISNNQVDVEGATAQGCTLYRCKNIDISGLTLRMLTGYFGVSVGADVTYPSSRIDIDNLRIAGVVTYGIAAADISGPGELSIGRTSMPDVTTPILGGGDAATRWFDSGQHSFGGKRRTFGTAAPTTGTWSVGDRVENTAPTAGGYVGFVCTTAGTPGTWKGYGAIAP